MKRLLIIPARLGSKRIKEKNIKKFFGKPIIYYSIELALKSGLFSKIHVSTESKKIKNIVEKFGLKIDCSLTSFIWDAYPCLRGLD